MSTKLKIVLSALIISICAIVLLSIAVSFLALHEPQDPPRNRVSDVVYEAYIDDSTTHKTPELSIPSGGKIPAFLRIRRVDAIEEIAIEPTPEPQVQISIIPPVEEKEPEPIKMDPIVKEEEPQKVEIVQLIEEPQQAEIIIPEPQIIQETPVEQEIVISHQEQELDDDFWADFFIQGEDVLTLEFGIYYMALFINEEYYGEIDVLIDEQYKGISTQTLRYHTDSLISEDARERLFSTGEDYLSENDLLVLGIGCSIDTNLFEVRLEFDNNDMPWKLISVAGLDKSKSKPVISGATLLEKENFSAVTSLNMDLDASILEMERFDWNFNLDASTTFEIYQYSLDIAFNLLASNNNISLSMRNWKISREFEEQMLKAELGNVQTYHLSPLGRTIGISLRKDFSYASPDAKRMNVHTSEIVIKTQANVRIMNCGNKIFEKVLKPGNYRLEDFILYQGLNEIVVIIEPLNGEPVEEIHYDFSYANSLLAPGEKYYGVSLAFGRENLLSDSQKRDGALLIKLGNKHLQYDIRNFSLSGFFNIGMTKSITLNTSLAFSNTPKGNSFSQRSRMSLELNAANPFGVLRSHLGLDFNDSIIPYLDISVAQQIPIESKLLSNVNAGISYSSPISNNGNHAFALSLSGSGSIIDNLAWNASMNTYFNTAQRDNPYSLNLGLSYSPSHSTSISIGFGISGKNYSSTPNVFMRVSGFINFDNGSSASVAADKASTRASYRLSDKSLSFSSDITMPSVISIGGADAGDYWVSANIAKSYEKIALSGSASTNLNAKDIELSISANTNILYAGGMFGLSSSLPQKYLLIKQDDNIKNNTVTASIPGKAHPESLNQLFSSFLYSNLNEGEQTSLELRSSNNANAFLGVVNDRITIPRDKIGAYAYTLFADEIFQVSGIIRIDEKVYSDISSPVYDVTLKDGSINLDINDDYYLFTDITGRFVLSDIEEGTYAFEVKDDEGEWNLLILEISGEECIFDEMNLFEISNEKDSDGTNGYQSVLYLRLIESVTEDEYWDIVDSEWEMAL